MMKDTDRRKRHAVAVYAALGVMFVALWLLISLYFAFVCLAIGVAAVRRLNSRIPYTVALVLMLIAALFEGLSYESAANWLAAIGFYGMAMGIVIQFSEFVRNSRSPEEESGG
jgi:cell division protein FtsW (lipid II flippase)